MYLSTTFQTGTMSRKATLVVVLALVALAYTFAARRSEPVEVVVDQ